MPRNPREQLRGTRKLCQAASITVFHGTTLDLSKKGVPTICKTLPLYKNIEQCLKSHQSRARKDFSSYQLDGAITITLLKLDHHTGNALKSDYPLLGAALHPALRLSYSENTTLWPTGLGLPNRARVLLEHLYTTYDEENVIHQELGNTTSISSMMSTASMVPPSPSKQSPFMAAIKTHGAVNRTAQNEVDMYLSGLYPYVGADDNPLTWWKQHARSFPVLSRVARDILTIPAVSVSVERLFSSSKHALDREISLDCKEWLKLGYGEGIEYLQGVAIHEG